MANFYVGSPVRYVGGGRFSGPQVFAFMRELRVGDTGIIHAIPGERGDFGCTFGELKVSLNAADLRLTASPISVISKHAKYGNLLTPKRSPPTGQWTRGQLQALQAARVYGNASTVYNRSKSSGRAIAVPSQRRSPDMSLSRPASAGATRGRSISRDFGARSGNPFRSASKSLMLPPIPTTSQPPQSAEAEIENEPPADSERSEPNRPHPPSFYCPISHQCMHDPVVLTDGHTYERRHIEHWLKDNNTSPVTGSELPQIAIFPNHALRNAIEEYFDQVLGDHRKAIKQAITGLQRSSTFKHNNTLIDTIDSLMQCSILVNADLSIELVLTKIMQEAKSLVGAEVASVFLVDRRRRELYSTVNSTGGELRIPIKSGVAGSVAYSGMPLIIEDAYNDARFNTEIDLKTGFKTRSILCVPIRAWKSAIIGVAQLINKTSNGVVVPSDDGSKSSAENLIFTDDDQQFFEVLASQAGAAIVNSGIFETMPGVSGAGRWPSPLRQHSLRSIPSLGELSVSRGPSAMGDHSTSPSPRCRVKVPEDTKEEPSPPKELERIEPLSPKQVSMVKPLLLAAATSWEMDVLSLAELTSNRPLSTLGMHLLEHHGLISFFNLEKVKLQQFLLEIERGYPDSNQYHNRSHAASVLHFMHSILSHACVAEATSVAANSVEPADRQQKFILLAGLLAAIVHDYQHEGVNNDFLVKSSDDRALIYNDKSPNENHHVSAAWFVLRRPECNFLDSLSVKEYRQLRSLVLDLVLSTDMAEHGNILKKFKEATSTDGKATASGAESASTITCSTPQQAITVLQMALKCSDLGHLSLSWGSHMRWVQRLEAEFFAQGDKELKMGTDVSFLMDRTKQGASDTQVGFFDFVVLPLFRGLIAVFPEAQPMMTNVEANYQQWKDISVELGTCR
mmetsp:Transcript_143224/g.249799  ORF Transcript_143224/g.249799 Transcript_143224/m.249799 type:complete len:907 (+) Transcript_143224:59-2779(+)